MIKRSYVSAFVRHSDSVVMIKHQGDVDPFPFWALPGGRVEAGETPEQAIIREIKEECGLDVHSVGELVYRVEMQRDEKGEFGVGFTYEISDWSGTFAINDPITKYKDVAFIPQAQVIEELAKVSYVPMREPPMAYLRGAATGVVYRYRVQANLDAELIEIAQEA